MSTEEGSGFSPSYWEIRAFMFPRLGAADGGLETPLASLISFTASSK